MITIEVNVYGGVVPTPITVTITELNGAYNNSFDKNGSLKQSFNLTNGKYDINVSGVNPYNSNNYPNIRTEISVYGDTSTGSINMKKVKTIDEYSAGFAFSI